MTLPTGHSALNGVPATETVMFSASASPNAAHEPLAQSQPPPTSQSQPPSRTVSSHQDATRQKIVDIIDQQFDLEILLRHSEEALIAQELAKAERMLEDLRHAILSGRMLNKTTLLCPCLFGSVWVPHYDLLLTVCK